jgi:hypothetical protein
MAGRQLGRWRCSTSLIGPRDGALLPSLTDPVRTRTHDAAPPRRGDRTGDQEDPDQIGDAGENAPGFEERMAAAIAPSDRAHDRSPSSLRGLQRLMDSHYRRRD